ncbi:MAG: HAMP domain-containing protein [Proteobacteria bacterium]|nr:HAMP domain-containing protein [Pseudomonadota bacterium]
MSLVPRSLFARTGWLLVGLIVVAQLASFLIVRQLVLKPRVTRVAAALARDIAAMRAGLVALPPDARRAYVDAFNARAVQMDAAIGPAVRTAPLAPIERAFVRDVSERVAAEGIEALWRRDNGGSFQLRLALDGVDYWVVLPNSLPAREATGAWIVATVVSALVALLGALLVQRKLDAPLRRVVTASGVLARGGTPERLPETGATEIAALARGFNQLVEDLARNDRERALMLAGISHDLRTPLTKLRLGVEILRTPTEQRGDGALITGMTRSIDEMDGVVGQFLDYARADDGEARTPSSLDAVAAAVAGGARDEGRALGLALGAPALLPMRAQGMRRAVANLVENAWRHGKPPVTVRTGQDSDGAWIEVSDAGSGIPAAGRDALREPFRRGDAARGSTAGAGLGLAIVERMARAHGGTLTLDDAPGGGLRARITLPLRGAAG